MARSLPPQTLMQKLSEVNWLLPAALTLLALIGTAMIYSAEEGIWQNGAQQHLIRFILFSGVMLFIAVINIRVWYMLAYPALFAAIVLLIGVALFGVEVNGSQRWLDIGPGRLQPSEIAKLALVLGLARYYHDTSTYDVSRPTGLVIPLAIIGLIGALIFKQPDLGTTLLLVATGATMIFLAGLRWRVILVTMGVSAVTVPVAMSVLLKPYQWERIRTFLQPERDPTGASYHILQSKIALGSGGVSGKGFRQGTQAHLDYVPENQTDFIFTVIGEEFGLIGGLLLMLVYASVMLLCLFMAQDCRHKFSRLLILGFTTTFSLYVFINLAMVTGLAPVVGVPLPLVSYGGTVMLTVMAGFGLVLSAHVHRQEELPGQGRL